MTQWPAAMCVCVCVGLRQSKIYFKVPAVGCAVWFFLLCTCGTAGWSGCPAGWWDEWPIFLCGGAREWGEPERVPEIWHTRAVPSRHPHSCWTPVCFQCLCRFDKWRRGVRVWQQEWARTMVFSLRFMQLCLELTSIKLRGVIDKELSPWSAIMLLSLMYCMIICLEPSEHSL